jgi:hypothetical protein
MKSWTGRIQQILYVPCRVMPAGDGDVVAIFWAIGDFEVAKRVELRCDSVGCVEGRGAAPRVARVLGPLEPGIRFD